MTVGEMGEEVEKTFNCLGQAADCTAMKKCEQ